MKLTSQSLSKIAMIAAIYVAISLALAPLSFGNIQIRIAEGLTLLPLLSPIAIIGLGIGCFITNFIGVIMGANLLGMMDVFIGTFATVLAAYLSYVLRNRLIKGFPFWASLMPIVINAIIIGAELTYVFAPEFTLSLFLIFAMEVALGQALAVYVIGVPLLNTLKKRPINWS